MLLTGSGPLLPRLDALRRVELNALRKLPVWDRWVIPIKPAACHSLNGVTSDHAASLRLEMSHSSPSALLSYNQARQSHS